MDFIARLLNEMGQDRPEYILNSKGPKRKKTGVSTCLSDFCTLRRLARSLRQSYVPEVDDTPSFPDKSGNNKRGRSSAGEKPRPPLVTTTGSVGWFSMLVSSTLPAETESALNARIAPASAVVLIVILHLKYKIMPLHFTNSALIQQL
ncbi:hypothetical protein [Pseudogemmobacter sp. W21_MBD1_M6]|uniref:hypothetical protein n=1 Tax=Pseudogemmobacter sp. W21_MBD1_M6 TaxID=3240271 RepID=UPI003F9A728E